MVWWLVACSGSPSVAELGPRPGHFGAYPDIVAAVEAGDVTRARAAARDLLADVAIMDDPHVDAVGGAAGFLTVADRGDLADGAVAIARGCRACHAARGIVPAASRAGDLGWDLVFGAPEAVRAAEALLVGGQRPTGRPESP